MSKSVKPPTPQTLARYGISLKEWRGFLARQGGVCAICQRPPNGWMCIDHEHVRGWKKLPKEERRKYVRGILCYFCNFRYVGRCLTAEKAARVADYLREYEARRDKEEVAL